MHETQVWLGHAGGEGSTGSTHLAAAGRTDDQLRIFSHESTTSMRCSARPADAADSLSLDCVTYHRTASVGVGV